MLSFGNSSDQLVDKKSRMAFGVGSIYLVLKWGYDDVENIHRKYDTKLSMV